MRKVELLPTRDCEAGYGPGKTWFCSPHHNMFLILSKVETQSIHWTSHFFFFFCYWWCFTFYPGCIFLPSDGSAVKGYSVNGVNILLRCWGIFLIAKLYVGSCQIVTRIPSFVEWWLLTLDIQCCQAFCSHNWIACWEIWEPCQKFTGLFQ